MFRIRIQSPFESTEVIHPNCSPEQALQLYQAVNWGALAQEVFERQGDVINNYYYFEIGNALHDGQEEILHISGYTGQLVNVDYVRPKLVQRGFFKKKEVLDTAYRSYTEARSSAFGNDCFQAFLRHDAAYLENNLQDQ